MARKCKTGEIFLWEVRNCSSQTMFLKKGCESKWLCVIMDCNCVLQLHKIIPHLDVYMEDLEKPHKEGENHGLGRLIVIHVS